MHLNQQILIRDVALQKVTTQGLPMVDLFSKIVTKINDDYETKITRQIKQMCETQELYNDQIKTLE